MTIDPVKAKNQAHENAIEYIVEDEERLKPLEKYLRKRGLKPKSRKDYLNKARVILRAVEKHPEEWTAEDIPEILEYYEDYSITTRNIVRVVIRHMLRCYHRPRLLRFTKLQPEEAETPGEMAVAQSMQAEHAEDKGLKQTVSPEWTQITEMHMRALSSQCHPNLSAFLWVLWDTGARPDDLRTLKLQDVRFYSDHIVLRVEEDTKTGSRPVPLNFSLGEFRRYLATHPYRERDNNGEFVNGDVALFLNTRNEPWVPGSLSSAFIRLRKRVLKKQKQKDWPFPNIPDDITMRMLRPNAVSRDRQAGMSAEENALIRGHDPAVMRKFYDHSDKAKQAIKAVARIHGREWEPEEHEVDPWMDCPKCNQPNPPGTDYCSNCGDPISPQSIQQRQKHEQEHRKQEIEKSILDIKAMAKGFLKMQEKIEKMEKRMKELEGPS